jgi:glucose 1-dehydrogenase
MIISSVHDVIPWAGHVNYAASKGGVMVMMRSLARELVRYKRIGEPKDAGKAVFLASDDSDYITGMYVDGGMTRHPELASGG